MKKYLVKLTSNAEHDIEDIYNYISKKDTLQNAEYVVDNLEQHILNLIEVPERGHYPPELLRQGIKDYREVLFKPYRVIYEIIDNKVIIHMCVDGRRDMKTLLTRRLFRD